MAFPQLKTLPYSPDGADLSLRIILPPNLASGRKTIPVKLEAVCDGHIMTMESLPTGTGFRMEPPVILALMLLEEWCRGRPASMLMLTPSQLSQLLQPLEGEPVIFYFNNRETPLTWSEGKLPGVHEHLQSASQPANTNAKTQPKQSIKATSAPAESPDLSPMEVDGSTHFLAITLPSRESSLYSDAIELVKEYGFRLEPSNRKWWLRDRHKTLQFLAEKWEDLENHYRARFTDNFRQRTAGIERATVELSTTPLPQGYAMDLRLQAKGANTSQIADALAKGQNHVENKEGRVILIESSLLKRYSQAGEKLTGNRPPAPTPQIHYRLSHAELTCADEALEPLNLASRTPEEWQRRSAALRDLTRLKAISLPAVLDERLRPYQRTGAAWLRHLCQSNLGGILADEMGLGKTVQALALIASMHHEQSCKGPCLIVSPAGLVGNWRREVSHFIPWLGAFVHHGSERLSKAEDALPYGIIITSYGTLSRDQSLFHAIDFNVAIADEAQHVKNRQTQNARALRGLQAKHRFLLTGTPVENSLDDLRSLFDFILPGYLPKRASSQTRDQREAEQTRLRDRAAPYILRRTKQAVAPELPEKIEHILYCELGPEQRARYVALEQEARREILTLEMSKAGEGRLRMAAFNELLRLRQLCIDPRLLPHDEGDSVPSAKWEAFREILEESLDGGHRMLVFSQFTSALHLLRGELESLGIPFLYLDGQTRDRAALCERFNQDESLPVFLISLKAGGTGLNLTGADTVVHYDPWWNPAVEAQATDRAHRIGQTRVVTSYKLIAAQTVEERVLALQQSKAVLLRDVFDASEAANARIGLSDLKELLEGHLLR